MFGLSGLELLTYGNIALAALNLLVIVIMVKHTGRVERQLDEIEDKLQKLGAAHKKKEFEVKRE